MNIIVTDDRENDFKVTKTIVKKAIPDMTAKTLRSFKVPGQMNNGILDYIYKNYTKHYDRVLDPMCSVGTSIYYGAKLGRRVYGFEIVKNLALLGKYMINRLLPGNDLWNIENANAFKQKLPKKRFRLIIFSPPQIMIKRGPYPAGRGQLGNFSLKNEKRYWKQIARIINLLKNTLDFRGRLVVLNVDMKRKDGTLYLFPCLMNEVLESCGLVPVDEVIVKRLHHKNIDNIFFEYLRAYKIK